MSCQLVLETQGPFYSGAMIQGKLVCSFNDEVTLRGIKVRVVGDEHTEWMSSESHYNSSTKKHETRYVLHTGDNNILYMEAMLLGSNHGEMVVPRGIHTYPFTLMLPENLPSTFENSYGHIRYKIKGIVDRPMKFDYEDKLYITLLTLIDLNLLPPNSLPPIELDDEKTVCCFCCASGPINMEVRGMRRAFIPGDDINLQVSLTNMSNINVDDVEVKLMQNVSCHVNRPHYQERSDSDALAVHTWPGVGAHGENSYDINLRIPTEIAIPNMVGSKLFDVSYTLEICAELPGCHADIEFTEVVYLGHIGLNLPPPGFVPPPITLPPTPGGGYPGAGYPSAGAGGYPFAPNQQPVPNNVPPYPGSGPDIPYPTHDNPPNYPYAPGGYPSQSAPGAMPSPYSAEKAVFPGGNPSAPSDGMAPTAPSGSADAPPYPITTPAGPHSKEEEARGAGHQASAPTEFPPPSYEQTLHKEK